jgi:hypothetical protein
VISDLQISPIPGTGTSPRKPLLAEELQVPVLTTTRRVLKREDHNLLRSLVDCIIDQIAVFGCNEFADAFDILGTTDRREERQILQGAQYSTPYRERRGSITGMQILGDFYKIARRARREPQLHRSKRRNAASTSSSVANSRRFACANPSSTAAKWAESTGSASSSLPANEELHGRSHLGSPSVADARLDCLFQELGHLSQFRV